MPRRAAVEVSRPGGSVICHALVADNMITRGVGLLGQSSLKDNDGLLIEPCTSVHTFFMRFAIDVLYLDRTNTVVKKLSMKPFRFSFGGRGAKKVLELAAHSIEKHDIRVGESLILSPQ